MTKQKTEDRLLKMKNIPIFPVSFHQVIPQPNNHIESETPNNIRAEQKKDLLEFYVFPKKTKKTAPLKKNYWVITRFCKDRKRYKDKKKHKNTYLSFLLPPLKTILTKTIYQSEQPIKKICSLNLRCIPPKYTTTLRKSKNKILWAITNICKDSRKKIITHSKSFPILTPPSAIFTKKTITQSEHPQGTKNKGELLSSTKVTKKGIPSSPLLFLNTPWGITKECVRKNQKNFFNNKAIFCLSLKGNCFHEFITSSGFGFFSPFSHLFSFIYSFRIIRSRIAECNTTYRRVLHCVLHVTHKTIRTCVTRFLTYHVNKVKAIA